MITLTDLSGCDYRRSDLARPTAVVISQSDAFSHGRSEERLSWQPPTSNPNVWPLPWTPWQSQREMSEPSGVAMMEVRWSTVGEHVLAIMVKGG